MPGDQEEGARRGASRHAAEYERSGGDVRHLGRSNEAVQVHEACLEIRKRVLGEEHPDTLQSMNNLAVTYDRLGRSNEAVQVHEACLEITKRVLGEEHPETLRSMNNLWATYDNLGRSNKERH